jgi:hypothetical protein
MAPRTATLHTYLAFIEDRSVAVKEIEWADDVTLDQNARYNSASGPPSRTKGHFKEPLLQRELAKIRQRVAVYTHCRHGCVRGLSVEDV